MTVAPDRLIADVRTFMGENRRYDSLLRAEDSDQLSLNQRIIALAPAVADTLTATAPAEALDSPLWFADEATPWWEKAPGRGSVRLPDNFLRLAAFRLDRWPASAWHLTGADSARLILLRSGAPPGVLADNSSPVLALCRELDGLSLEFFSTCGPESTIAEALYWPRAEPDGQEGFHLSDTLYHPLLQEIASRLLPS